MDSGMSAAAAEAGVILSGIAYYLANQRARNKSRNVRYSQMLLTDLEAAANVWPWTYEERAASNEGLGIELPSDMYDGLVSSTNISYFDTCIQEELRAFYDMVRKHNREIGRASDGAPAARLTGQWDDAENMGSALLRVTDSVKDFRSRNELDSRLRKIAKPLHLYYENG